MSSMFLNLTHRAAENTYSVQLYLGTRTPEYRLDIPWNSIVSGLCCYSEGSLGSLVRQPSNNVSRISAYETERH